LLKHPAALLGQAVERRRRHATTSESAFYDALEAAEAARQNAKSSAQMAYGFMKGNFAAYQAALIAADVAFINAVTTAATANGISPSAALGGPIAHARWAKNPGN
jgi:hypothetical protein